MRPFQLYPFNKKWKPGGACGCPHFGLLTFHPDKRQLGLGTGFAFLQLLQARFYRLLRLFCPKLSFCKHVFFDASLAFYPLANKRNMGGRLGHWLNRLKMGVILKPAEKPSQIQFFQLCFILSQHSQFITALFPKSGNYLLLL